jgi:hypothetical protein
VKALERRVGAQAIELDTELEFVICNIRAPGKVDLTALAGAAFQASYTLKEVEIETAGTVVAEGGKLFLELDETKQRIELRADVKPGAHVKVEGKFVDWVGDHFVLAASKVTAD